ncbi:MAG: efflux RND transporter periplasmic adaptor subunit, partial [Acidobacteriota bacterium]|nr:efflux RND transporter periplasmic adaptor subunit [Acidobacteriota bacterium]
AELAQARVALVKATTDADRSRQLYDAGIIPLEQWQNAQDALHAASASVQVAQSGVADARVDLAYVEIRAPITGTVASVSTQEGETVAASFATPTFVTIIRRNALELVAMVDEADIGNVRSGETASFTTETWPDKEFTGTVLRVAPVATIISGVVNYEVTISIRSNTAMLKPDMTANVNIVTAQREALEIPPACLHRDQTGTWVYIRAPSGEREQRAVTVGARSADGVEISRGLTAGNSVLLPAQEEAKP